MPDDDDARIVQNALTELYDIALDAEPHATLRATRAYSTLVKFIADVQMPDPAGVEPERVAAVGRLLLDSGDITPTGARMLEMIAAEAR